MSSLARIWVAKLTLTNFRNYNACSLSIGPEPVVLIGPNGAGKTNCLEALSLLSAGRGLRGLAFSELGHQKGDGGWAVSAQVRCGDDESQIGTGLYPQADRALTSRTARLVRIDGAAAKSSSALSHIRMLWLTPAMDGLFTGAASDRRKFMDRFTLSLAPQYAAAAAAYDRAMRQRNKALEMGAQAAVLDAIEIEMAEAAVMMAAQRMRGISLLQEEIHTERDRAQQTPLADLFPWAELELAGDLEKELMAEDEISVQSRYLARLRAMRERDAAAGRTLIGPHRTDLLVTHGPRAMAAKMCSTGEQKALLTALILAQARLIKQQSGGMAPLLLLDEIAAHLDENRRAGLFSALLALEAQVWMTGTDFEPFAPLKEGQNAQFFHVLNGVFTPHEG